MVGSSHEAAVYRNNLGQYSSSNYTLCRSVAGAVFHLDDLDLRKRVSCFMSRNLRRFLLASHPHLQEYKYSFVALENAKFLAALKSSVHVGCIFIGVSGCNPLCGIRGSCIYNNDLHPPVLTLSE